MSMLHLLRKHFCKTLEYVYEYTGTKPDFNCHPFMFGTYEYFRYRHLINVTDFTTEEEDQFKQQMPTVFTKLGKDYALWYNMYGLTAKDVFDYVRFRSAIQFLIDDTGKFVPDGPEKDISVSRMIHSANINRNLLEMDVSYEEYSEYPNKPVPEHIGVPESHDWWYALEFYYQHRRNDNDADFD